jgi:Tfp pilus assembly protein PilF
MLPAVDFRLTSILLTLGRTANAEQLVRDTQETGNPYTDQMIFMLAETLEKQLETKPQSVTWYEEILMRYPQSLYCNAVRKHLREIQRQPGELP